MAKTKPTPIDEDQAGTFIKFLTGSKDSPVHFQTFNDSGKGKAWHRKSTLQDILPRLQAAQNRGCGIFASINDTDGKGRYAANATDLRCVFIDGDGIPLPEKWHVEPHMIVQRDKTHWHVYWKITNRRGGFLSGQNDINVKTWKMLQRYLAAYYGTDPKIVDPSRVMRIPGTLHQKNPNNLPIYKITKINKSPKNMKSMDFLKSIPITKEQEEEIHQWLFSFSGKKAGVAEGVNTDTKENQQRYLDYLEELEPSIEGDHGDTHAFAVCCKGRDYGLSDTSILECLLEEWNDRCEPPWDIDDLETKIQRAGKYQSNAFGCETPQADFEAVEKTIVESNGLFGDLETPEDAIAKETDRAEASAAAKAYDAAFDGKWTKKLNRTAAGALCQHVPNAEKILVGFTPLQGLFGYNEFSNKVCIMKPPLWDTTRKIRKYGNPMKEVDAAMCVSYIHNNFDNFPIASSKMEEAISVIAETNKFHPIRKYVLKQEWDGVPRLDNWLNVVFGVEKNAYTCAAGRKTIVAMVKRVFQPGCKFDNMLILEGCQGINKSRILQILAGGAEYFTDNLATLGTKDAADGLQGKWLIEFAEITLFNKSDANLIKQFMSTASDTFRKAYHRHTQDYLRQSVAIGTTNKDSYLKDETGNRRFWPVKTIGIGNAEWAEEFRDQLFAEAYQLYLAGEKLYLEGQALQISEIEQRKRHEEDAWENIILDYLNKADSETGVIKDRTRSVDIWVNAFGGDFKGFGNREQSRMSQVLRKIGWERKTIRINGTTQQGFVRVEN